VEIRESTRRLAVKGLDWRHVDCSDVYHLASSFKGSGIIKAVSKYQSLFGKERLAYEQLHGPKWDYPGLDQESALRQYERDRLKYYYFVIELDSPATADRIY
jgi:hypothetical protein